MASISLKAWSASDGVRQMKLMGLEAVEIVRQRGRALQDCLRPDLGLLRPGQQAP
jgi:hypothetical protein